MESIVERGEKKRVDLTIISMSLEKKEEKVSVWTLVLLTQ